MKIALGIYRLQPRGGLEDNCIRIAEELASRGHQITIFVAGAYGELPFEFVRLPLSRLHLSNHARAAAFAAAFAKATAGRFDRTVGFQPIPGSDVIFLADTLKDRADAPFAKRLTPRFRTYVRLEKDCFSGQSQTRVIGLAAPQMEDFAHRYPGSAQRMAIIPPTLPRSRRPERAGRDKRDQKRRELGLDSGAPVWLWLGLQPRIKGLDRVIEALKHNGDAHLLVGGLEADDRKIRSFLQQAERSGVKQRIQCLGYIGGDRLIATMAAADVLAHPARLDVTGGVILEALINGLPVVATSLCGFAEHIDKSGAGKVLAAPFDPNQFNEFLRTVCGPGNDELSRKGLAYGMQPELYSGIAIACDLIEASQWRPADTSGKNPGAEARTVTGESFRLS